MPGQFISRALRRSTAASAAVLFVVLGATSTAAGAQTPPPASSTPSSPASDIPSVGVSPTESHPGDPNEGQWFVFSLAPGKSAQTKARINNPADVAQTVRLYVRDLTFSADGTPTVSDAPAQADVGLWGTFAQPTITIGPRQTVLVPFSVAVPDAAEPGDHVGVVVVESAPQGGAIKVVRRVATRMYVTVPGDATKSFSIVKVDRTLDSTSFPAHLSIETTLRNTGRVRLHPAVRIGAVAGKGADALLARSVEPYQADVKVPWYGGPVKAAIVVTTEGGLTRTATASMFVVPWGLILAILLLLIAGRFLVWMWRRRRGRIRGLQQDVRRLEQLVAQRPKPAPLPDAGTRPVRRRRPPVDTATAAKRAQRAKSTARVG